MCFNYIGKHNGFMHTLDAVPVHSSLCNSMKRTLAVVEIWFIKMLTFLYSHTCLVGFLVSGCMNHAVASGLIKNCCFTEVIFMQNEYGLGKE